MKLIKGEHGSVVFEAILVVLVFTAIGSAFYFANKARTTKNDYSVVVPKSTKATSVTPTKAPAVSYTPAQLIAVAQKVYYQAPGQPAADPYISICQKGSYANCPFTSQLTNNLNNFKGSPGFGPALAGGAQNGPFGNASYSATPSSTGGTVEVTLVPTASEAAAGNGNITWKLTIVDTNGTLLVNDITISMSPHGKTQAACGPVEIYNDTSC